MATPEPRWLAVHRHRIGRLRAPFVLVVQHHLVRAATRIVAPIVRIGPQPVTFLAPRVVVGELEFGAILLEMAASPLRLLAEPVAETEVDEDAVATALDAIFRGYPVGLPLS